MKSAADEFIRGKPAIYSGFDGKLYRATYFNGERNQCGIGHLEIATLAGEILKEPLMAEHKAHSFFWNLDASVN